MTVSTHSKWYYGYTVNEDNLNLPFSEGGPELLAELNVGSYTLEDFATEVVRAMNSVSLNNYVASVDRATRRVTITGDSNFELLSNSSSLINVSIYPLLGFVLTEDKTGSNSYESDNPSGFEYKTQFKLQNYIPFDNDQKAAAASVNESATGIVEVISYGNVKLMTLDLTYINDYLNGKDNVVRENLTGVSDLRQFMEYAITKGPMEFMEDEDDVNTFDNCFLEKANNGRAGTGFRIRELYTRGLTGYYEIKGLKFRKIES